MTDAVHTLRLATRQSRLALWQTEHVAALLRAAHPDLAIEIVPMTTQGDRIVDRSLAEVGGKGLFIKELELAIEQGRADIAVHSMKDVPSELPPGMSIAAMLPRADPRDAFISKKHASFDALPRGARVGTSSPRRQAQLKHARADLEVLTLRGNVETRLRKLDAGEYDAIILAAAGLTRLGLAERITHYLDFAVSVPAVGQGIIGIECRSSDARSIELVCAMNDVHAADRRACAAGRRRAAPSGRRRLARRQRLVSRLDGGPGERSRTHRHRARGAFARGRCGRGVAAGPDMIPKVVPPLTDATILVTRPAAQAESLCAQIERFGGRAMRFASIAIEPLAAPPVEPCDLVVFVSVNAVEHGKHLLANAGAPRIAAIGKATAAALKAANIAVDCVPESGFTSEALLAHPQLKLEPGMRALIVRGSGGRELLQQTFADRGLIVQTREVYQRVCPTVDANTIEALENEWSEGGID